MSTLNMIFTLFWVSTYLHRHWFSPKLEFNKRLSSQRVVFNLNLISQNRYLQRQILYEVTQTIPTSLILLLIIILILILLLLLTKRSLLHSCAVNKRLLSNLTKLPQRHNMLMNLKRIVLRMCLMLLKLKSS